MSLEELIPLSAIVAGLVLIGFCLMRFLLWRRVKSYQRTEGRLVSATLKEGVYRAYPVPLTLYIPRVKYEYSWRGGNYVGERITLRDKHLASVDEAGAGKVLKRIDARPAVFVDPSNPHMAVLINRLQRAHWDFLATYTLVGILLVLSGWTIIAIV